MTPINWPASLPCFRFEPYQVAPRPGAIEFDMGMLTHRARIYTQNNEVVSVEIILDATDEPTLRTFYKTTTAMGTQWFNVAIEREGEQQTVEAMFYGAPPVFTPIAHNVVRATFTLLTRGEQLIPGPAPEYVLTANNAVNIGATLFSETGSIGGTIVTINTLVTDKIIITKPSIASDGGLTWDAWSFKPENDDNGGFTWLNDFRVSDQSNVLLATIGIAAQTGISQAFTAIQASMPVELTGSTQYKFWSNDFDASDNRRGLSLRVKTYSLVV